MPLCDSVKHIEDALEIQAKSESKCSQSEHWGASPRREDMMEMASPGSFFQWASRRCRPPKAESDSG